MTHSEFIVTHAPDHVRFLSDPEQLKLSEIQDIISLAFGFDVEKVTLLIKYHFDNDNNN